MSSLGGGQSNDNNSIGVLKSEDGGATWSTTELTYSTSENKRITRLLIHPSNNLILFASMWDGNPSTSGCCGTSAMAAPHQTYGSSYSLPERYRPTHGSPVSFPTSPLTRMMRLRWLSWPMLRSPSRSLHSSRQLLRRSMN